MSEKNCRVEAPHDDGTTHGGTDHDIATVLRAPEKQHGDEWQGVGTIEQEGSRIVFAPRKSAVRRPGGTESEYRPVEPELMCLSLCKLDRPVYVADHASTPLEVCEVRQEQQEDGGRKRRARTCSAGGRTRGHGHADDGGDPPVRV